MRSSLIVTLIATLILASCGSQPVKPVPVTSVSLEDIQTMQSLDELTALYTSLEQGLAGKEESEYASDFAALAQVQEQILLLQKSALETSLEQSRLGDDSDYTSLVPLPALQKIGEGLNNVAGLDESTWANLTALVDKESTSTKSAIDILAKKIENKSSSGEQRIDFYQSLYTLSGDEAWRTKQESEVDALLVLIREATEAEAYDEQLQSKIALVKAALKDNAEILDEMIDVDAKIYAKKYFDALSNGDADSAYKTLQTLSQADDFSAVMDKLKPSSQKMAEYFTALADESVTKPENLGQSYRWYQQASEVRHILGLKAAPSASTKTLVTQLDNKYKALKKQQEEAAALAVLYAIQDFNPTKPGLRKSISQQEKTVLNSAIPHLSTTDFDSRYRDQDYGDVITTFITQYLFEHIPNDVRIVEREQYEAIMRERKLSGNSEALSSVDLLVSGSVLESKVDSSEAKNKKLMRVVVGKETVPNPGYTAWLKMSNRDRKRVDQPSETITVNKEENISVGVTRHRKVGIFSVSYRLVEAESGEVIFPDSIMLSKEYEDESSEGVEIGEVVVPFKLADLPSDVKILDELAREVATEIGQHLVATLENQELKYLESLKAATDQNDCVSEVDSLANALMIMQLKKMDTSEVKPNLKKTALNCY
ncbi:hypothetical protein SAMN02745866_03335 [Alteromonadaceae bacterium Bs31]|nr:hypothetical protein SAMN02745866_03335 [Alteromonadaceae bacterium Bs31]